MEETRFKRKFLTRQMVLDAIDRFERDSEFTEIKSKWRDNRGYKYALRHRGRLYPPKPILSLASGFSRGSFNGGDQTNRVFRQLGFDVIDKPA